MTTPDHPAIMHYTLKEHNMTKEELIAENATIAINVATTAKIKLNQFRQSLVEQGSAKLLTEFDEAYKQIYPDRPYTDGLEIVGSVAGLIVVFVMFILPWLYGYYVCFKPFIRFIIVTLDPSL